VRKAACPPLRRHRPAHLRLRRGRLPADLPATFGSGSRPWRRSCVTTPIHTVILTAVPTTCRTRTPRVRCTPTPRRPTPSSSRRLRAQRRLQLRAQLREAGHRRLRRHRRPLRDAG
jgi:hypothetical protein